MRNILGLSLQFGALVIPVGLSPTRRDGDEKFRKLHRACNTPIRLRAWCDPDEQLLTDPSELVTAWAVADGEYVVLDPDELAALEPSESRTLAVTGIVAAGAVPHRMIERFYYLAPSSSRVAVRTYALLAQALGDSDAEAVGRFVAWGGERICAIAPIVAGDRYALELRTLAFAEDTIDVDELAGELAGVQVAEQELELALDLVGRLTRKLRTDDLESRQRPLVRAMLERKLAGEKIVRPADTPPLLPDPGPLTADLTGALKTSLRKAPRRKRAAAGAAR